MIVIAEHDPRWPAAFAAERDRIAAAVGSAPIEHTDGAPTHHLSLTRLDGAYWTEHLAFRDALRDSPELAGRYGALKRRLAGEHDDPEAYTRAKTALVRDALLGAGHVPRSGWAADADRAT